MFLDERLSCSQPSSSYGNAFSVQITETLVNRYAVLRHPYIRSRFSLVFANQTMAEQLAKTVDIFNRMGGMAGGCLFRNPSHFSSNNYRGVPTNHDQLLEQVGPDTYYLTVWYGTPGGATPRRRIKKPVIDSLVIAIFDGVSYTPTVAYSINPESGLITLDSPLSSFESLYAGFYFDVPVMFETDMNEVQWQGAEIESTAISLIETLNPEDL